MQTETTSDSEASASDDVPLRPLQVVGTGLALFVFYLWMMQRVAFSDGARLFAADGSVAPLHFLYPPLLTLWRSVWEPLGLPAQFAATAFSSFGTAIGVMLVYLAIRGLETERIARRTAVLLAITPAVLFWATTIEIHGVFFAILGLVALATSRLMRQPVVGWGIATGLLTGASYVLHNSGAMLPALVLPIFWSRVDAKPHRLRRDTVVSLALTVAHGAMVLAGYLAFVTKDAVQSPDRHFTRSFARTFEMPEEHLVAFWTEWLLPFFPMSILFLFAAVRPERRRLVLATIVAAVPYVGLALILLVGYSPDFGTLVEKGAYPLPLAWPLAWLVAATLPRRAFFGVCALSFFAALFQMHYGVDRARNLEFQAGLAELTEGAEPLILIGDPLDLEACVFADPRIPNQGIVELFELDQAQLETVLNLLAADLERRTASGQPVFVTDAAFEVTRIHAATGVETAIRVERWLTEELPLEEADARGFHGHRLVTR